MKKSPGKILLFLVLLFASGNAGELARYTLTADKYEAHEREAVVVTFVARQLDHTDNMMFLVAPKKNDDYKIILLNKTIDDKQYHDSKTTFTYVLFPLKAKTIHVGFDFTIRTASDKAVAHSYVDDHDDSIAIQTNNSKMDVTPLSIDVKAFDRKVDLVGDFNLEEKLQKTQINQYESVNIVYTLSGKGYEGKAVRPLGKIDGVTIFSETNDVYDKITTSGYAFKREYIYALSAKKDFTIPGVTLQAYSPRTHRYYTLTTPGHQIKVTPIDTAELLDTSESPVTEPLIGFESIKHFFIYLILFLLGYASAKLQPFERIRIKKKIRFTDIRTARTPKKLLTVVLKHYDRDQLHEELELLEEMVYRQNSRKDLKKIKNAILKKLED